MSVQIITTKNRSVTYDSIRMFSGETEWMKWANSAKYMEEFKVAFEVRQDHSHYSQEELEVNQEYANEYFLYENVSEEYYDKLMYSVKYMKSDINLHPKTNVGYWKWFTTIVAGAKRQSSMFFRGVQRFEANVHWIGTATYRNVKNGVIYVRIVSGVDVGKPIIYYDQGMENLHEQMMLGAVIVHYGTSAALTTTRNQPLFRQLYKPFGLSMDTIRNVSNNEKTEHVRKNLKLYSTLPQFYTPIMTDEAEEQVEKISRHVMGCIDEIQNKDATSLAAWAALKDMVQDITEDDASGESLEILERTTGLTLQKIQSAYEVARVFDATDPTEHDYTKQYLYTGPTNKRLDHGN